MARFFLCLCPDCEWHGERTAVAWRLAESAQKADFDGEGFADVGFEQVAESFHGLDSPKEAVLGLVGG